MSEREPQGRGERRWRTGRKVGRTIYEQIGSEPSDGDRLIGLMDSPQLASQAVIARNAYGELEAKTEALPSVAEVEQWLQENDGADLASNWISDVLKAVQALSHTEAGPDGC